MVLKYFGKIFRVCKAPGGEVPCRGRRFQRKGPYLSEGLLKSMLRMILRTGSTLLAFMDLSLIHI